MAGLWYRAGTISVTNGSKKITGFGTQWATAVIKPKKGHTVHAPDGRQYELDYVESDTVMYIVTTYAGVTATGQAYAIDITRSDTIPAFSRDLAAFTAYAQGQYDSWQQVLTGTDTVTLTAPDGQQIQVPALSALQPASASLKAIQALVPSEDKMVYYTSGTAAALAPLTSLARALLAASSASAARGIIDAYGKTNILGDVTQSGGIPTGAILERGSNANGEYIRMADGTQICWKHWTINTAVADDNTYGSGFYFSGVDFYYPIEFAAAPALTAGARSPGFTTPVSNSDVGTVTAGLHIISNKAIGARDFALSYVAVGRWF